LLECVARDEARLWLNFYFNWISLAMFGDTFRKKLGCNTLSKFSCLPVLSGIPQTSQGFQSFSFNEPASLNKHWDLL